MRTLLALSLLVLGAWPAPAARQLAPVRKTVAVLAFDNNTGQRDYDHLGTGMAAMMTTDLAAMDELRMLERERIDEITKEIDRQQTRYYDSTTAVNVGRLTGAQYIVAGSMVGVKPLLRIDTRVIEVETGEIVKTAQVTGRDDEFFDLEKRLARQLLKDLDVALTPESERQLVAVQEANRVDDLEAIVTLSNAMNQADAGDYAEATITIAPVVAKYPNSVFVKLTAAEIKKRAAASTRNKVKGGINKLLRRKWPYE